MRGTLLIFLLVIAITVSMGFIVSNSEWDSYKGLHGKRYANMGDENFARLCYAFNKYLINKHNRRYDENLESYRLDVNQFSDLRFVDYAGFFPPTADVQSNGVPYIEPNAAAQASFFYANQGYRSLVQNQGLVCNSGWAYSTATALQIFYDVIAGNPNSQLLSAQNLIDCAGGVTACIRQVPQTAFDYLTRQLRKLFPESEYRNNPFAAQGVCNEPVASTNGKSLISYSNIPNGNDALLKKVVNYAAPVVIKFNPGSFEFMHYKQGVFTQPRTQKKAAHFLTVVGYGTDTVTGKSYWQVQNSFGTTWGEAGMIRIEQNAAKPIANSAMFPLA